MDTPPNDPELTRLQAALEAARRHLADLDPAAPPRDRNDAKARVMTLEYQVEARAQLVAKAAAQSRPEAQRPVDPNPELKRRIAELEAEMVAAWQQKAEAERRLGEAMRTPHPDLVARIADLEARLADAMAGQATLSQAVDAANARVAEREAAARSRPESHPPVDPNPDLVARIADLEARLADAMAGQATLSQAVDAANARVAEFEAAARSRPESQPPVDPNPDLVARIAGLESELAAASRRKAELDARLAGALADLAIQVQAVEAANTRLAEGETRLAEARAQLAAMVAAQSRIDPNPELKRRLSELEARLADATADQASQVRALEAANARLAEREARLADLEARLATADASQATQARALEVVNARLAEREAAALDREARLAEAEARAGMLERRLSEVLAQARRDREEAQAKAQPPSREEDDPGLADQLRLAHNKIELLKDALEGAKARARMAGPPGGSSGPGDFDTRFRDAKRAFARMFHPDQGGRGHPDRERLFLDFWPVLERIDREG